MKGTNAKLSLIHFCPFCCQKLVQLLSLELVSYLFGTGRNIIQLGGTTKSNRNAERNIFYCDNEERMPVKMNQISLYWMSEKNFPLNGEKAFKPTLDLKSAVNEALRVKCRLERLLVI